MQNQVSVDSCVPYHEINARLGIDRSTIQNYHRIGTLPESLKLSFPSSEVGLPVHSRSVWYEWEEMLLFLRRKMQRPKLKTSERCLNNLGFDSAGEPLHDHGYVIRLSAKQSAHYTKQVKMNPDYSPVDDLSGFLSKKVCGYPTDAVPLRNEHKKLFRDMPLVQGGVSNSHDTPPMTPKLPSSVKNIKTTPLTSSPKRATLSDQIQAIDQQLKAIREIPLSEFTTEAVDRLNLTLSDPDISAEVSERSELRKKMAGTDQTVVKMNALANKYIEIDDELKLMRGLGRAISAGIAQATPKLSADAIGSVLTQLSMHDSERYNIHEMEAVIDKLALSRSIELILNSSLEVLRNAAENLKQATGRLDEEESDG